MVRQIKLKEGNDTVFTFQEKDSHPVLVKIHELRAHLLLKEHIQYTMSDVMRRAIDLMHAVAFKKGNDNEPIHTLHQEQ
jgi:galactokinase